MDGHRLLRVYLDTCCLNRPFDDQMQDRIRLEAEAVVAILSAFEAGEYSWVGSDIVLFEIQRTPDFEKRHRVNMLASNIGQTVSLTTEIIKRAKVLESLGFHPTDALHIACAEEGKADIFLTTDDEVLKRSSRFSRELFIRVTNPLSWMQESRK